MWGKVGGVVPQVLSRFIVGDTRPRTLNQRVVCSSPTGGIAREAMQGDTRPRLVFEAGFFRIPISHKAIPRSVPAPRADSPQSGLVPYVPGLRTMCCATCCARSGKVGGMTSRLPVGKYVSLAVQLGIYPAI